MRKIYLQYINKKLQIELFDNQHSYTIMEQVNKTMPYAIGYMTYDESTQTWQMYRIRTGEWIYRRMPKLMAQPIMEWIKSTMTKQYRGIQGYK